MGTFAQDVRFGIRQLRHRPGYSLVAIVTLALGIGMSTALFTIIDATLLRPLPYPNPEQLVTAGVTVTAADGTTSRPTPSMADLDVWRSASDIVALGVATRTVIFGQVLEGAEPERVEALLVDAPYLAMHGAVPLLGRDLVAADAAPEAPAVALVGYGFWQSRFGGDEGVVGQTLRDAEGPFTIVGVLPRSFGGDASLLRPLKVPAEEWDRRGSGRPIMLRLQPGLTPTEAERRLTERMPPGTGPNGEALPVEVRLSSRLEAAVSGYSTTVSVITGAVALVLLIACVNVAGLLLARGAGRHAEMAVRASLGAGRGRLIRQLLTESMVLATIGGAAGIGLAWFTLDWLVSNVPMTLPDDAPASLNGGVFAAAVLLTLGTGLICGLAPAFRLSAVQLNSALASAGRQQGSVLSRRGSQALISAEVALAVVLVIGAGLMLRSYSLISAVDVGFDPDEVFTLQVTPLDPAPNAQVLYYPELLRRLRAIPGITAAGAVDHFPMAGSSRVTFARVGGESVRIGSRAILPGYFEALGLTLVEGELPTETNFGPGQPGVAINESAARELFDGTPATGRSISMFGDRELIVIGVVSDVRHSGPLRDAEAEMFVPIEASESALTRSLGMTVVVRPQGSIPDLGNRLREAARAIGPPVLIEQIRSGRDWLDERVVTPRRRTVLLGLMGGLGLLLSLIGIFGMTAFAVARRTREVGVRMAFGAQPGQVVGSMVRDAAMPIVIGTVIGLGGALLATRVIASFLFGTAPTDPVTFAGSAFVLMATGLLAAWLPARRAAGVDPVSALRAE